MGAALIALVLTSAANAQGKPKSAATSADAATKAIHASSSAFAKAFNAGNAKAVAALWTADGDYVDEDGNAFRGRDAIEKAYAKFFANNPGVSIRVNIDAIRLINKDTAIEDGTARLDAPGGGDFTRSRYTAIHSRVGGKWLMSSVRDASLAAPAVNARLGGLAWMIGEWHAEHQGASLEMSIRWIADKAFIERDYTVRKKGRVALSGKQIIGWDPVERRISSWLFDSSGSYAIGAWSPTDNGWVIRSTGVTGDGTWTRATNMLSRVHDALVWKSTGRSADSFDLPNSEEIVLKRKSR